MNRIQTYKINGAVKEIYFVCVTFTAYLFMGLSRAYIAFLFRQLDDPNASITLDDERKSMIAALCSLLSPLGCLLAGVCLDLIGRKRTVQLIYLPTIGSWILTMFADDVYMLYVAFSAQGLSIGMTFCIVSYVSEICTAKYRGSLFVILIINYNFGILISNYLMYLLEWKLVALIYAGVSAFILLLTCFLPESPIWLYLKGKEEKSIKTLCFIRSKETHELESEIEDLKKYCSMKKKNNFTQTLRNCLNSWRQLFILIFLFFFTVNTGFVLISIYGIILLDKLDLPYDSAEIMIIFSIVGTIACFVTPYFMYKLQRRTVLMLSSSIMGVSFSMIVLLKIFVEDATCAWVFPLCLFIYSFGSNLGAIPLAYTMSGEILPNESRGVLGGIHGCVGFLYATFQQKILPGYLNVFGIVTTIGTFAVFSFMLTSYAYFIVPETKGKTLNEVQDQYFTKKKRTEDFSS